MYTHPWLYKSAHSHIYARIDSTLYISFFFSLQLCSKLSMRLLFFFCFPSVHCRHQSGTQTKIPNKKQDRQVQDKQAWIQLHRNRKKINKIFILKEQLQEEAFIYWVHEILIIMSSLYVSLPIQKSFAKRFIEISFNIQLHFDKSAT